MNSKIIISIFICVVLTACAPSEVIKEKKVPIYMVPEPPTIEKPELPIHNLELDWSDPSEVVADLGKIAQAYVISVRLLMNWGEANSDIVLAYKKMSERDFSVDPISFSMTAYGSEADAEGLEMDNESDYGTIERYANKKFREIEDKYHHENEQIMKQYQDETQPD